MKKLLPILLAAGMVSFGPALHADDYPSKPITIVAFRSRQLERQLRRVVGERLGNALKQTVMVDNRPGANGAPPPCTSPRGADGYTLLMATNSPPSAVRS